MFVSVPVQVRFKHLSEIKGAAATAGLSIVNFGTMKEGSKAVTIGIQGTDRKVPGFVKVLVDSNAARLLPESEVVESISTDAKTN